jgi:hypothetical protein
MLLSCDSTKRLARFDAFALSCPREQLGAGLVPARWPDQKPVRLVGVTHHSPAAAVSLPQTGTDDPQRMEVYECLQSRRIT